MESHQSKFYSSIESMYRIFTPSMENLKVIESQRNIGDCGLDWVQFVRLGGISQIVWTYLPSQFYQDPCPAVYLTYLMKLVVHMIFHHSILKWSSLPTYHFPILWLFPAIKHFACSANYMWTILSSLHFKMFNFIWNWRPVPALNDIQGIYFIHSRHYWFCKRGEMIQWKICYDDNREFLFVLTHLFVAVDGFAWVWLVFGGEGDESFLY